MKCNRAGLQVVYVGDGNNITHSWLRLAARFPFELVCACPPGYEPDAATVDLANAGVGSARISHDIMEVNHIQPLSPLSTCAIMLMCSTKSHAKMPQLWVLSQALSCELYRYCCQLMCPLAFPGWHADEVIVV